ncbi:MAG TPA: putative Ig domain-containing protein, partial [Telluria sp.]|nr:putative Ig domain-containing protein [Telluria sp.]
DTVAPQVAAIERLAPSTELTDADALSFRVSFTEAVRNVDASTFTVAGTTAKVSGVVQVDASTYEVNVSGGDLAGYNGAVHLGVQGGSVADGAGNKLTVTKPTGSDEGYVLDNSAPQAPTVDRLTTTSTHPVIGGTATLEPGETLTITVNGATYTVTPEGGRWSLDLATAVPASGTRSDLAAGTVYDVAATVADALGHRTSDATTGELTVARQVTTAVTIDAMTKDTGASASDFITSDGSGGRTVSGGIGAALNSDEAVQVSFDGGATWVNASVSGTTWSATDSGSHASGWTISARVVNTQTSEHGPGASQAVILDATPPAAPTVNTLRTTSANPVVSGTAVVGEGELLKVTINGVTYTPAVTGGAWSVDLGGAAPLTQGQSYDVAAVVTDAAGNSAHDVTTGELTIDLPANETPTPPSDTPTQTPTTPTAPADTGTSANPAAPAVSTPAGPGTATPATPAVPAAAVVTPAPFVPVTVVPATDAARPDSTVTTVVPGGVVTPGRGDGVGRVPTQSDAITELQVTRAAELSDVYTSSSGFRTVVAKADEPALVLFKGMPDQYVETGTRLALIVPADAFAHTQPKEVVRLAVSQQDGRPLPSWIQFDAQTGTFKGEVPKGATGELRVKITARDMEGREATAIFRINLGKGKSAMLGEGGKRGLSEQLRMAARAPARQAPPAPRA